MKMDQNSPNILKLTFLGSASLLKVIDSIQRLETSAGMNFSVNTSQKNNKSAMTQLFNNAGENEMLVANLSEVFPEDDFTLFRNYDEKEDTLHVHVVVNDFSNPK